jgi:hypothetical protein
VDINAVASNKDWEEKWIYYQHLSEIDPSKLNILEQEAKKRGYNLSKRALGLLRKAGYNHHIKPIVGLGLNGVWDKSLIDRRTDRICDILWDRIYPWLL